jgi:hypothetical protein
MLQVNKTQLNSGNYEIKASNSLRSATQKIKVAICDEWTEVRSQSEVRKFIFQGVGDKITLPYSEFFTGGIEACKMSRALIPTGQDSSPVELTSLGVSIDSSTPFVSGTFTLAQADHFTATTKQLLSISVCGLESVILTNQTLNS